MADPRPQAVAEGIGNRIAPVRFIVFMLLVVAGVGGGVPAFGWRAGTMLGFDAAALVFLVSCVPMLSFEPDQMRAAAVRNDANRVALLAITVLVLLAVLAAVGSELAQKGAPKPEVIALVVTTLVLAWCFSNTVYTLHYAHIYYTLDPDGKGDRGGLSFPKTEEPDYWDFVYFSFCLGMTFQTSDVEMETGVFRRVATFHCLAAFVFNLGVLAFTINVLGGG